MFCTSNFRTERENSIDNDTMTSPGHTRLQFDICLAGDFGRKGPFDLRGASPILDPSFFLGVLLCREKRNTQRRPYLFLRIPKVFVKSEIITIPFLWVSRNRSSISQLCACKGEEVVEGSIYVDSLLHCLAVRTIVHEGIPSESSTVLNKLCTRYTGAQWHVGSFTAYDTSTCLYIHVAGVYTDRLVSMYFLKALTAG